MICLRRGWPNLPAEVDLLIDADQIWNVYGKETIPSSFGLQAVDSKFGWLLIGPSSQRSGASIKTLLAGNAVPTPDRKFHIITATVSVSDGGKPPTVLDKFIIEEEFDLRMFWGLEHLGIADDPTDHGKRWELDTFEDRITRQGDGRYLAPFPWKPNKILCEIFFFG